MQEADAPVTTGSLRSAAAVMDSLAAASPRPSNEVGQYLWMASRLREIAAQRESSEPDPNIIPIPADALSDEAADQVLEHAHNSAADQ